MSFWTFITLILISFRSSQNKDPKSTFFLVDFSKKKKIPKTTIERIERNDLCMMKQEERNDIQMSVTRVQIDKITCYAKPIKFVRKKLRK